jgi:peptidoglycan hydrolase-like protein with peptidoglycan-binding domain
MQRRAVTTGAPDAWEVGWHSFPSYSAAIPFFERCLVQDSAHITPGTHGPHVNKIQTALSTLDHFAVAPGEVQSQTYGPSTAAGVLAYKQKRNIINQAYQTQADNIVGKMTIASLDAEMARVEPKPGPTTAVNCFPSRLYSSNRVLFTFAIPAGNVSAVSAAPALTPDLLLDQAKQSIPTAIAWCSAALTKAREVRAKIQRFHVYTKDEIQFFEPIQIHFKVNIPSVQDTEATDRMDKIIKLYQGILRVFGTGTSRMIGDPNNPNKATAPLGGFSNSGVITIGKDFANSNTNMRAAVLIHESGHFFDANCSHAASELPAPDGTAIDDSFGRVTNPAQKNYAQLDFALSIRNAYSVAQCAMHNGLGFDKRPP